MFADLDEWFIHRGLKMCLDSDSDKQIIVYKQHTKLKLS